MNETRTMRAPLAEGTLRILLDQMDVQDRRAGGVRGARRYRHPAVDLAVEHLGGGRADLQCWTRMLTAEHLWALHPGYIHPKTPCRVRLPAPGEGCTETVGTVAACRHVSGVMHEVQVAFEEPVDLERLAPPMACLPSGGAGGSGSGLRGRAVVVEDDPLEARMAEHLLSSSGLRVSVFHSAGPALELLRREPVDVLLCDLNLGAERGEEMIAAACRAGDVPLALAITAEEDPRRRRAAEEAGAAAVLLKPVPKAALLAAITGQMRAHGLLGTEVLHSSMAGSEPLDEVIGGYVDQAHRVARDLMAALRACDAGKARELCRVLRCTAETFGFALLGTRAAKAVTTLDATGSLEESAPRIREVAALCRALRAGRAAAS